MSNSIIKKYRPKRFSHIMGQKHSIDKITAALVSGILPPAYVLSGIQGGGKTTTARLITMSLNCTQRDGIEPCGTCPACTAILNDCSNYLMELDGARHGKVDDAREIMASVQYLVADGSYKVIIIDECHGLTTAAWNAALKTIEEPPPNVMFIFCTTEFQKVPGTIKSRCVHIQLPGVTDDVLRKVITNICAVENIPIEEEALQLIVKYAFGSIRDAQTILEGFIRMGKVTADLVKQTYQTIDPNTILTYFNSVVDRNIKAASNMTQGWLRLGITPQVMISALLEHLRNMIMDFLVEDKALKALLKAQKEKIGAGTVAEWIAFFYDQLKFIREYPMEYTLTIDLITIKLIDSLITRSTVIKGKKTKKGEEDEIMLPTISDDTPTVILPINKDKAFALQQACGGTMVEVDPQFRRVTLRNDKGTIFDIVSHPSLVKSDYFILDTDLDIVLQDYPDHMADAVKTK